MNALWIASLIALWLVVGVLAVLVLGFLRRVSSVLEAAEGVVSESRTSLGAARRGMRIAPFKVFDSLGVPVESDTLFMAPAVYVLLHSGCAPCRVLAKNLAELPEPAAPVNVIIDDSEAARSFLDSRLARTLFERDGSASQAFMIGGTPQAFAVATGGTIIETLVPGSAADIERLANVVAEGGESREGERLLLANS